MLYVGVTSNLIKRIFQHRNNLGGVFTKWYNVHNLVWYEVHERMENAILREKQIRTVATIGKNGSYRAR